MAVSTGVQIKTLAYAIVYVKDTKKATEFYTKVLGAKIKSEVPGWVEFDTGATTLALHEDKDNAPRGEATVLVFPVDDIDAAHDALKASGAKITMAPHQVCETPTGYGFSCDFKDIDGNALSLYGEKKK